MNLKARILQKKNLWHVAAITVFLLISSIYFSPTFSGHTIIQGDVQNWAGSAQEILDYRAKTGEEALWTNSMFGGMPATQISVNNSSKTFINSIRQAFSLWLPHPIDYLLLYFVGFYILALSLRVKPVIGILGSIAYGLSSYFIIILQAGHNTKAAAIGFAPFVIAGFIMAYRRKKWFTGVALSALFMSFELSSNHFQITYYLVMVLVAIGIVELVKYIKKKEIKKFGIVSVSLIAAYLLAYGLDYGSIKGTQDYAKYTTRGGSNLTIKSNGTPKSEGEVTDGLDTEYITAWSYGVGETFSLIIPNYKGGATQAIGSNESNKSILKNADNQFKQNIAQSNQYFGEQPFTSGPVYIGIIVVFLALLALFYLDDKIKWALLAVTILTIMLSWGKNFLGLTEFFVNNIPGYNKFRAVTIILFVAELTMPILAILFLNKLVKKREEITKNLVPFYITSGVFALLLIFFLIAPQAFNSFVTNGELAQLDSIADPNQYNYVSDLFDELAEVRASIFKKDVLRSFIFLLLGAGSVFFAIKNSNFAKKGLVPTLAVLILFDLISVDTRYLGTETKGKDAQWTEVWKQQYPYNAAQGDQIILNQETANNPELATLISNEVAEVKKELKGQKLKNSHISKIVEWHQFRVLDRNTNYRVYEQGNPFNSSRTSYFHKSIGGYHGAKIGIYQDLIEFHLSKNNPAVLDMLNTKYVLSYGGSSATANPTALGNAWFVKNVKNVTSSDEEILALCGEYKISATGELPILINGEPIKDKTIKGIEDAALVVPNRENSTDTIPLQLPLGINPGDQLSYISTQNGPQWAYTAMLDSMSALNQIAQFSMVEKFDPKSTAIVHSDFKLASNTYSGDGSIKLTEYKPNKLTYQSSSISNQLAVFSEIYYPHGWTVTINGKPAEFIRANYVLRALEIPAGENTIEFKYELDSFNKAKTYTWITTIIILLLVGAALYFEFKDQDNQEETLA